MLTISLTYYNQGKKAFLKHLELWKSYSPEIRKMFKFIVVDDCSKTPLEQLIKDLDLKDLNFNLYRVDEDLYCNIPGAMNLSAKECITDWILFLDMDTLIDKKMSEQLSEIIKKDKKKTVYKFNRITENKKDNRYHKIHPKVCLIRVKDFWDIGGYDEDLVGHYGMTDPIFFYRAKGKIHTVFCNKIFIRHYDKGEADIVRDLSHNIKVFEEKKRTGNWCKDYFRFKWHQVL
jgi:predicted glycosyltransferase involved in capsule biosynthesis